MAQTKLVKLLSQGDVDVSELSETNISEYIQAKETLKRIKTYVVDPFEMEAKTQNIGELHGSNIGNINLKEQIKDITYSPKELCTLTDSMISMYVNQNSAQKRLDGVKRYNGQITIDADHLNSLIQGWRSHISGTSTDLSLSLSSVDTEQIQDIHVPRLITVDSFRSPQKFNEHEAGLYLGGKQQMRTIQKDIINPFENAFKQQVQENQGKTVLDLTHYGNLSVAVKAVPRQEANFGRVIRNIESFLQNVSTMTASQADGTNFLFNEERLNPTMYVNANHLKSTIDFQKNHKDTKFKKEISVLYKPQNAHIIMN
jgi:hypothetical protein